MRALRLIALLAATLLLCGGAASAQKRVALVVGNGDYEALTDLKNPPADAEDIGAALQTLGFTVRTEIGLTQAEMIESFARFAEEAADADVAFFYYAGHGLQVASQNFLVPVDAVLRSEDDVYTDAVPLDSLMSKLERVEGAKIILLDACRNNPLPPGSGERSQGLARVGGGTARDFLIGFATQPGNVAYDGNGRNSFFAQALLTHLPTKGQDISATMIAVRKDVIATTTGNQIPWENTSLTEQVYLAPGEREDASPETLLWRLAGGGPDADLLRVYLDRYPSGAYVADVQALLEQSGTATVTRSAEAGQAEVEEILWTLASNGRVQPLVELYLARYPDGAHAEEARALMATLTPLADANAPPDVLCERLATHPRDATANVNGVMLSDLQANPQPAIEACRAAVAAIPDNPHYVALLARAVAASGDQAEAVRLYREAADRGDARAMVSLGLLAEAGAGVPKDPATAADLYARAAERGFHDGMINLAVMLFEGIGVEKNVERAIELLRQASESGSPLATYNLAALYEKNFGSPDEALQYFVRAAEQGEPRGWRAAAVLLDEGRGVERDTQTAAEYLLKGLATDNQEVLAELTSRASDWSPDTRRAIQERLRQAGYYQGEIDAQFGPQVAAALKQWRLLGPPAS
jgi:uncharacterized caspase-like protein/TPR repeat protein